MVLLSQLLTFYILFTNIVLEIRRLKELIVQKKTEDENIKISKYRILFINIRYIMTF